MLLFGLTLALIVAALVVYALDRSAGAYAIQFALGMAVVAMAYAISLWVLQRDELVVDAKHTLASGPSRTIVVEGYADSVALRHAMVDTLDPSAQTYAALPRSVNRVGGAQFTYRFWIMLGNVEASNVASKDILLRGDPQRYNLVAVDTETSKVVSQKEDVVVKCPRIRFDGAFDRLAIEMNTLESPDAVVRIASQASPDSPADRRNLLSLIPGKWVLFTFVFRDAVGINEFENGTEVRFYLDDVLHHVARVRGALRQNNGHLYLFPGGSIAGCKVGDLVYHNYALSPGEVAAVRDAGPPKKAGGIRGGPTAATSSHSTLELGAMNKADLYNS